MSEFNFKEGRVMVFNNISAILWWSVLLEEPGASTGKNP
jgi:hypothetical protein